MESFTPLDFLSDDLFIKWQLTKDDDLERYWADFAVRHPECLDAMKRAQEKLHTMRINDHRMSAQDKERLLNRIAKSLDSRTRRRKLIRTGAVAASVAAVAVLALFLAPFSAGTESTVIGHVMPSEDIRLAVGDRVVAVGDGAEIIVNEAGSLSIRQGDGESEINVDRAVTHTLTIPYGKRSSIVLPDGSKVWLNSGSQLEFSSDFSRERTVAVSGEAFVDVVSDNARPFIVRTSDMTVRVFGTRFNVYDYGDDPDKSVMLVEGQVEVTHAGKSQMMKPNGLYSIHDGVAQYRTVANADDYYSWTRGVLSFENSTIAHVLEKIGRYYNVDFRGESLDRITKTCSGKLILSDNLEDILHSLHLISGYEFDYTGNAVYMAEPKNDKH